MRRSPPHAAAVMALLHVLLAGCSGGASPERAPTGRNVLFIMTEDQGYHLSTLGTPGLATPHEDALVRDGVLFTKAYVTLATCTGSKSSLMTGLYNHTTGATGNVNEFVGSNEELQAANPPWLHDPQSAYNQFKIRQDVPTLIEILKANGYFTGLQNKFHLAPHSKFPYDLWYQPAGDSFAQVSDFIGRAKAAGRPWFLMHVIINSHRPFPDSDVTPIDVDPSRVSPPAHLPDTPTVRQDWSEYLQALEIADRRVGDALRALDDSGEADNTIVVFMGDHGPAYHRGKWTTYNLGLQVSLAFRGPGVRRGVRSGALVSGVDVMPTLLDFMGLPAPKLQQGISQRDELEGRPGAQRNDVLVGEAMSDRSLTDGRFHLIFMPDPDATVMPADNRDFDPWRNRVYRHILENKDQAGFEAAYRLLDLADRDLPEFTRPRFELYDLENDPWEIRDLAADPGNAAVLDQMKAALRTWMDRVKDPDVRP